MTIQIFPDRAPNLMDHIMMRIVSPATALSLALVILPAGGARADAIDGNWSHDDGRRFTIQGSNLVTPAGKAMQGHYERHYFSYVVPAPEANSGQTIFMTLRGENNVSLRIGDAANGNEERWVRCAPSISRTMTKDQAV